MSYIVNEQDNSVAAASASGEVPKEGAQGNVQPADIQPTADEPERVGPTYKEKGKARADPDSIRHDASWELYNLRMSELANESEMIKERHRQDLMNYERWTKEWSDKHESLHDWAKFQGWPEELQVKAFGVNRMQAKGWFAAFPEETSANDDEIETNSEERNGASDLGHRMQLEESIMSITRPSSIISTANGTEKLGDYMILLTCGQIAMADLLASIDSNIHHVMNTMGVQEDGDAYKCLKSVDKFLGSANRLIVDMVEPM
ncbi:hypothetical protein CspHIS471_0300470 [Cutaneotrichosporon sp. HIS471]|nr:hypothetical protein CspHIS471_0300470 [Cutaneotrichosporon sp. HIS471]